MRTATDYEMMQTTAEQRLCHVENTKNTRRFIIYSRNTKIYDRKAVQHVFMGLVQTEWTQKLFSQKFVFSS
jgi:hypothetical protein